MAYARIRDLREDKDLSQRELAEILHCSQRIYSNYERGDVDIPTEILRKLAQFHKTSVDYLLGLTDEQRPYPRRREQREKNSVLHFRKNGFIMTSTC